MNAGDVDLLIKSLLLVVNGVVVPWAIVAYQTRTGVQVTDQQRAAIQNAAKTTAGIVETMLDQKTMPIASVTPDNKTILDLATAAVGRVPAAASAQNTTPEEMAALVVGLADTTPAANAEAAARQPLKGISGP